MLCLRRLLGGIWAGGTLKSLQSRAHPALQHLGLLHQRLVKHHICEVLLESTARKAYMEDGAARELMRKSIFSYVDLPKPHKLV